MFKSIIVNIFNCFCVFYFAGNQLRENSVVDTALRAIENGFANLNDKLIDLDVLNSIDKIGRFFLCLSVSALVLLFILARIGVEPNGFIPKYFYLIFLVLLWFSIMFWGAVNRRKKGIESRMQWLVWGTVISIVVSVSSYYILSSPNQMLFMPYGYQKFDILTANVNIFFLVFLVFVISEVLIGMLYGLFTLFDLAILFFMLALVYLFRSIACFIAKMSPSGNRFSWFLFLIVILINFT